MPSWRGTHSQEVDGLIDERGPTASANWTWPANLLTSGPIELLSGDEDKGRSPDEIPSAIKRR